MAKKRYLINSPWFTAIAVSLLTAGLWQIRAWQPLEQFGYNGLFQIRNTIPFFQTGWDRRIAVIAIDEKSLKAYGRFQSWNRQRYVQLLQVLAPAPPAAIGFDIIFSEPSPEDNALAEEIQFNGSVVLAVGTESDKTPIQVVPKLAKVAWLGHIVAPTDSDGINRQLSLYSGGSPAFSLVLLEVYQRTLAATIQATKTDNMQPQISLPKREQRDREQFVWLNWPGLVVAKEPPIYTKKELHTYSFVDVVEKRVEPRIFANKLVLVGATATALDPFRTPFNQDPPTSGVYVQAAVVDNLLNGQLLHRFPFYWTPGLLVLLALITTRLLNKRHWQGRLVTLGLLLFTWCVLAILSFSVFRWWIPTIAPLGTIFLAAASIQLREQYEKQQLMSLFSQHVAPEMAKVIWQRKEEIFADGQLEPQELTATILFADLRDFTTISENLSPRELLSWLNLYLDAMTRCLMEHGGVIDKYMGDAIMAVFGIPFARSKAEEIEQDALNAVAASLVMHERLHELNRQLTVAGKPLIQMGIGIHTGQVVVGSVGGTARLNYSVVGDTVNVAARLEAMNKDLVGKRLFNILVSGTTLAYLGDRYFVEEVGLFQLRGKAMETKVYSIVGAMRLVENQV